jgi:hypothetical protein
VNDIDPGKVEVDAHQQPRQRQNDNPRNDRLDQTHDDLFQRYPLDADRRQQAVFDLLAPAKVDDQRQRHCLHAGKRHT